MLGEAFALASVLSFSFGSIAVFKAAQDGRSGGGALLSVVMTAAMAAAVWLLVGSGHSVTGLGGDGWKGLLWFAVSGLLTTTVGRSLYFVSIRDLGSVRAAAVKRVTPLFSVLLAVVILGEILGGRTAAGLALVAASLFLLFGDSIWQTKRGRGLTGENGGSLWRGYGSGALSGFSYAAGFVTRKLGLALVPDGIFGTLVGALAALSYYAFLAAWDHEKRTALHAELAMRNSWHWLAALAISTGQICMFVALQFTTVTRVAIIYSLEVFVTMVFAIVIFRTEVMPDLVTIVATLLATVGVIIIVM
ncbi:DMT family transporter [Ancylobacter polymorphus]|nr:DMT family transporter [Ancylobacter polymorphus]